MSLRRRYAENNSVRDWLSSGDPEQQLTETQELTVDPVETPVDEAVLAEQLSSVDPVETPVDEAEPVDPEQLSLVEPVETAVDDAETVDPEQLSLVDPVETPVEEAPVDEAPVDEAPVDEAEAAETLTATPARSRWQRSRKPILVMAAAAAVLLTAGAGTWVAMSKTVTITVDGQQQQVTTLAGSVSGALEAAGLSLAEHDSLAPAAAESISDGSNIAINRGRQVTLTIDGKQATIWTTAKTLEEALAEVGRNPGDYQLSADRSRTIPLEGLAVTGETLHSVKTVDGTGAAVSATTTAKTVGDLLTEKKIVLGPLDTVKPAGSTALADGLTITVTRVTTTEVVVPEVLAQLPDSTVDGPDLAIGSTEAVSTGAAGNADVTYQVTNVNGVETSRVEASRVVTLEPTATVTKIGSKPGYEQVGNRVFFHDTEFGVNWDGLAECESTNNPAAVDPTGSWYGMFQFDFPTWASVGGSGNPADASPEEQLMRAKLLYQSRGLQPWLCAHAA